MGVKLIRSIFMLTQEFKRLIKSKSTIIILVLFIIGAVSFFISYGEKQIFVNQLANDFSPDLNRTALANFIDSYTGVKFLFDFWFNSDFSQISTFILYIWIGIFLSPNLLLQKGNGWGNFLVVRKNYPFVSLSILSAQSLYIFVVITITTVLQLFLALILGGWDISHVSIGEYELNIFGIILIIIAQIFIMSLYTILANSIAMMSSTIIKNKYIVQAAPLLIFAICPMLLSSTVGNISTMFAKVIIYFEPYNINVTISNIFQACFRFKEIICNIFPFVFYSIVLFVLVLYDMKRNSMEYI